MSITYICDNCWQYGEELCIGGIIGPSKMYTCVICGNKFSRGNVHAVHKEHLPDIIQKINIGKEIPFVSDWIAKSIKNTNSDGIVIGLSGGIDSAVAAALAAKAVGQDKVLGIIIPCESDPSDKNDAVALANFLGIKYNIVNMTETYNSLKMNLSRDLNRLTKANIKARLRMTTLYAFANQHNYLNMGTTNKTELMIGYFTKYGDGGVDFEPLGDYYKDEIYIMAKCLNIPEAIINKKPSAGLWQGQTDEDELGISYKDIDRILRIFDTIGELSYEETCELWKDPNTSKLSEMIDASNHKRCTPPILSRSSFRR